MQNVGNFVDVIVLYTCCYYPNKTCSLPPDRIASETTAHCNRASLFDAAQKLIL